MLARLTNKNQGFTLLELLIVIVIIGILAVIIVPGLASGPQRARDAQRKADIRGIKNALETYYNDQTAGGKYPNIVSTTGITDDFTVFSDGTNGLKSVLVTSYLPSMPQDPKNSGVFKYYYAQKDTTASSAIVGTCLENTKDSTVGATAGYATPFATPTACGSGTPAGVTYIIQTLN